MVDSHPSAWRPLEIAPGPPAMFSGACRTRGLSDKGTGAVDLDLQRVERAPRTLVELLAEPGRDDDIAEPLRPGGERRQHRAFAPVEAGLVDPVELERRSGV